MYLFVGYNENKKEVLMKSTTTLFNEKSRELHKEFDQLISEYRTDLWQYCKYLTGSPWDGEDLFQETILKAFGGFYQLWQPTNPKSYLYRVATNTWIDHCRREKRHVGTLEEVEKPSEPFSDTLEIEEALEHLIGLFAPRQVSVFLLFEVFKFKATEVASIVRTTEGAVYATVRRMKLKLSKEEYPMKKKPSVNNAKQDHSDVIQAYLKAINEGDLEAMLALVSDSAHNEASLGFHEFSKDEMRKGSMQFGLPGHRAEQYVLWGKSVIIVFVDQDGESFIHDIQYQVVENEKIVHHKSYFFRKEFIFEAAKEIGVPPQLNKPPVQW